jgi:glycosyltransferase involved in cell wall biosynthesis
MTEVLNPYQTRDMFSRELVDNHRLDVDKADVSVSVVMPAYNCESIIESSLRPLLDMRYRGEVFEVIVVDDGSTDGTAEVAASLGAIVISTDGPHGPASARNRGVQAASGDILWFVDSDVVVNTDACRHIRQALASREITAVVGSYDDSPQARNFCSQYKNLVHHHYHQRGGGDVSTFWGGCGAVWKDEFLAVGGFDELRYPRPSIEDIEFGYRLKASGARIRLVPELQGKHLKVWTIRGLLRTELRDRAVPWSLLLLSRGKLGDELNIATSERIRAMLAGLVAVALVACVVGFIPWQVAGALLAAAIVANMEMFVLFRRRNGLLFAFGGVLFHQIYYLYSTAAYCSCWLFVKCGRLFGIPMDRSTTFGRMNPTKSVSDNVFAADPQATFEFDKPTARAANNRVGQRRTSRSV